MATTKVTANVLADNSVTQAKLADDAVGADELAANAVVNASIASGAAIDMDKLDGDSLANAITDFAQDDLVILSDTSDSGNLAKITTSNFEDAIFGNISGDVTLAAGGAATLAAAQTNITSILNTSLILGRDADNQIKFGTDNQIIFEVDGGDNVIFKASGEIEASSLDISGDVDVDGTLEADAITINGTTLAETISDTVGAMVGSNTETGIAVTYDDSDNTLDFVIGSGVIASSMIAGDAIDGSKIADDAIDSEHYADGSIDTAHLADGAITAAKIADGTIVAAEIADNAVTTAKINADAVTGAKIADDAIDSEHYTDGSIDTAHLGDLQVTTAKIAADAITGAKLADDAVNSEHYTDGSIDTAHIADDQITSAKLGAEYTSAQAVTSAATITLDTSAYDVFTWAAGHTANIDFTNVIIGKVKTLVVTGGGSSYALTLRNINGSSGTFNLISGTYDDTSSTKNIIQVKFISTSEAWYTISKIGS